MEGSSEQGELSRTDIFRNSQRKSKEQKHVRRFSALNWEESANVRCWKKITNVIYSQEWQIFLMCNVCLTVFIVLLKLQTTPSKWYQSLDIVNFVCSSIYFVDTLIHIVHKYARNLRLTQSYQVHPTSCMVLDIISLLPIPLIYRTVPFHSKYDISAFFEIGYILRVYRIPFVLRNLIYSFKYNEVSLYIYSVFILTVIFTFFLEFIWIQVFGRWTATEASTWLNYVKNIINIDSSIEWFVVSFATVLTLVSRVFEGSIQLVSNTERLTGVLVWFIGTIIELGCLMGGLAPALAVHHKPLYRFDNKVAVLDYVLLTRNLKIEDCERARAYYRMLWKKASGIEYSKLFDSLTLSLRKEVLLDVFWEAMKHSNLLHGQPLAVKRSLCMVMRHKYFLPGEVIYAAGQPKAKMVYIVSGVVDLFSSQDVNTPIASFTAGTLLGEATLVYQYTTHNAMKCATVCVVQVLHSSDFLEIMKSYPTSAASITLTLRHRIKLAKEMRQQAEALRPPAHNPLDEFMQQGEIKWVKDRWRKVMDSQRHLQKVETKTALKSTTGQKGEFEETMRPTGHTFAFFDLFTLADETQKAEAELICLRETYPWIMRPNTDFTVLWEIVLLAAVAYELYILPFYNSFSTSAPLWVDAYGVLCDVIFIIDLYVTVHTAEPGVEQTARAILMHRFQSPRFILKLITGIPWHWIAILMGTSQYNAMQIRYIRIIWAIRSLKIFEKIVRKIGDFILLKYSIILLSIIYFFTCWQNLFSCYFNICGGVSWYTISIQYQTVRYGFYDAASITVRFYDMLMMAASYLLRINFMMAQPLSIGDYMMQILMIMISLFLLSYWAAELSALRLLKNRRKRDFYQLMAASEYYQSHFDMSTDIWDELISYLCFQWQANEAIALEELDYRLNVIPHHMHDDFREAAREALRSVPFIASGDPGLIEELADEVKFFQCPKNMILLRAGDPSPALLLMRKGFLRSYSHWRPDVERGLTWSLVGGEAFPLLEVAYGVPSTLTVRSESACILATIETRVLRKVVARYPMEDRLWNSVVDEHRETTHFDHITLADIPELTKQKKGKSMLARFRVRDVIKRTKMITTKAFRGEDEEKTKKRQARAKQTDYNSGSSSSMEFDIQERTVDEEEADYERPWKESVMGFGLRKILRAQAFDPSSTFIFRWEVHRVCLSVIGSILHPCAYSAFIDSVTVRVLCYLLDFLGLVDIYIRMQVGYYNEDSILITHPMITMKKYLKTAFLWDFLSLLPIEMVPVHFVFAVENVSKQRFFIRLFRCIQIYRYVFFMKQLSSDFQHRFLSTNVFTIVGLLGVCINLLSNYLVFWSCEVYTSGFGYFYFDSVQLKCNFKIMRETFLKNKISSPTDIYAVHLYYIMTLYTSCYDGFFVYHSNFVVQTILICIFSLLVRLWVIGDTASLIAGERWGITRSRVQLHEMTEFLRRENVDERLVQLTEQAMDVDWKLRRGLVLSDVCIKVPPLLQADVMYNRCKSTLFMVDPLHGASESLLREISRHIEMKVVNKDRFILRSNDVQDKVYILDNGRIEVIGVGNISLCMLTRGAIFGNLPRQRNVRHTCGMRIRKDSLVMVLPNEELYEILDSFPNNGSYFEDINVYRAEYVQGLVHGERIVIEEAPSKVEDLAATRSEVVLHYTMTKTVDKDRKTTFNEFYSSGALRQLFHDFIVYFVIPPSVSCVLLNFAIMKEDIFFLVVIYTCDFIYLIKICLMMILPYIDDITDEVVTDKEVIRKTYVRNPYALTLDLLSTVPFEIIGFYFLRLNRILRGITFIQYNEWKHNQLTVSSSSRWARMCIIVFYVLIVTTSIYIIVRCDWAYYCEYLVDIRHAKKSDFRVAVDTMTIFSVAFVFTASRLLSASFFEPPVNLMKDLVYNVLSCILNHSLRMIFSSYLACFVIGMRKSFCDFRFLVDVMDKHLENLNVSLSIRKRLRTHMSDLKLYENGSAMPKWLKDAPMDLRFDLMAVMYGKHLQNDPILSQGHDDLLFQMSGYLCRSVYYPGDLIVEKNDVDGQMYILDKGEIKAVERDRFLVEKVIFKLEAGTIFGVKSGILEAEPHCYTYRSCTTSVILTLNQLHWKYLFDQFPASKENILKALVNASI